jgi:hypothetical protein
VWGSEVDGVRLTFHLAGINNQNFIMRDEETGTYWQQISGRAISGPLRGRQLPAVPFDELNFATWRKESPQGTVLKDVGAYVKEYAKKDWDVRMRRAPVVIDFPEKGRKARDLMLGLEINGASRAYLYDRVLSEKLVKDYVGGVAILLVVGEDGASVRAFRAGPTDFYRLTDGPGIMMDAATGRRWDFQGCASSGVCLERVPVIKDYWFDWRNYHPSTTVW